MNVDLGIWKLLTRLIICMLLLAVGAGVVIWYLPLFQQNERMRKEILRLEAQVKQEQDKARYLEETLHALRHDPKTVERMAREKLGYAKPGETVIYFEEPVTNTTPLLK